jgi:2-dehydro-3-deoxyphosphogluconate aldolase/(4S)-4-hydroxy-2-oxoglutarate aldolase
MVAYLNEPHIPCIGGSWIVKKELVDNEDWSGISARAKEVLQAIRRGVTNE